MNTKSKPFLWIPSLYLAEGLPYVAVMTISVIMYKRLGISNTDIALYTGWLYLPWVIKPFWSPFVDLFGTKRKWAIAMQSLIAVAFACIAFSLPTSMFFRLTLAAFWLVAFTSATHDIAADGFYIHALSPKEQSLYVGIRSTFYRIATVAGQGLLVILAGLIEMKSGLEPALLQVDASPQKIEISTQSPGISDEGYFCFTPIETNDQSLELVNQMNGENGFSPMPIKKEEKKENDAEDVWYECMFNSFTQWLRNNFGEKERKVSDVPENKQIVGISLSKCPATGHPVILNMAFKKGDKSIRIGQECTRFEFTEHNWDKKALMIISVDPNLKSETSATFEGLSGNIPFAWMVVFVVMAIFFLLVAFYHKMILPSPVSDCTASNVTASSLVHEFLEAFKSFFTKKHVLVSVLFMLLYRLPEAQLVKLINPFMLDSIEKGGLGLTTGQVGFVYGTVGIIGLTIGGILGGIVVSRDGLKKWLWPMVLAITLPNVVYVYLSYAQPDSLGIVNVCVCVEQFGYGFGFTAYMLYMIIFAEGKYKTAHYAICTGFMALGMMLPGMMAGWLQETIGYNHFFWWVMICCLVTFAVTAMVKLPEEKVEG